MKAATVCPVIDKASSAISIHAAREGGDDLQKGEQDLQKISIHAAREGGDAEGLNRRTSREISIHAAREGGDFFPVVSTLKSHIFQSTPPVKAATPSSVKSLSCKGISIHAAREGGDAPPPGFSAS